MYRDEGKYAAAEPLLTRVMEVRRRVLGQQHPDTLISMNNLGLLYTLQSTFARAEPLLVETLELRRRILGQEHPDTLISMNNLGLLYTYEHKDENAEPIYLEALELERHVLAPEHPRRLAGMNELGALYLRTRKYALAEGLLREALDSHNNSGTDTWVRYNCESLLGASLLTQRKYAEAEPLLLSGYEGMSLRKTTMPWDHQMALNDAAERILQLYESWGKPEKMAEWREKLKMNPTDLRRNHWSLRWNNTPRR
jgi:hypothetical protein